MQPSRAAKPQAPALPAATAMQAVKVRAFVRQIARQRPLASPLPPVAPAPPLSLPLGSFQPLPPSFEGGAVGWDGMSAALRGTAVQPRTGSTRTAAAAPVQAAAVQTRKLKAKDAPKPPPPPPRKSAGGTMKVGGREWVQTQAAGRCRGRADRGGQGARPARRLALLAYSILHLCTHMVV